MARRRRVFAPGLLYHVMARGNRREAVFLADPDYGTYLDRLAAYRSRYGVTLYAYCLMPNHVHLVVRTAAAPLDRFMQGLQQSYTQRYNGRHGQVGHVFQGRYKALLCGTDEYLVTLVRYVHLNPVRAGLAARAEDYPYSAHRTYLAGAPSDLVDPGPVLQMVGGIGGYARLVEGEEASGEPEAPGEEAGGKVPFVAPAGHLPIASSRPSEPLEYALNCLAQQLRTGVEALRSPDRSRGVCRSRALAAFVLIRRLGYRVADVAAALGRDGTTTTIVVARFGQRMRSDPVVAQDVDRLAKCIEVKA